jgi:hypothetical protein
MRCAVSSRPVGIVDQELVKGALSDERIGL